MSDLGLGPTMERLVREHLTPLSLAAFLEAARLEDLTESFALAVRYEEGEDVVLAPHRDASGGTKVGRKNRSGTQVCGRCR